MYSTLDGGGALRSITGATPAAAAEISETVPTGARWELIALRTQLVTSATAGARRPILFLDDGANVFARLSNSSTLAASLTGNFTWIEGSGAPSLDGGTDFQAAVPSGVRLGSGYRIRTSTTNIQAGDQFSAVQYLVREWLEGA